MAETSEGTSKPSDFFVGVVDFFSILLPGALLTFLTEMLLAERTSQHPMLGKALKELRAERAVGWVAFAIASYILGHFVFIVGSFLLDKIYDNSYRLWFGSTVRTLNAVTKEILRRRYDVPAAPVEKLSDQTKKIGQIIRDDTLGLAEAFVRSQNPAGAVEIDRCEADSKFFRSLTALQLLGWPLLTWGWFPHRSWVLYGLVILFLLPYRLIDRLKTDSDEKAFTGPSTARTGPETATNPETSAPNDQSTATTEPKSPLQYLYESVLRDWFPKRLSFQIFDGLTGLLVGLLVALGVSIWAATPDHHVGLIVCYLLFFLSLWRFMERRIKRTKLTYEFFVVSAKLPTSASASGKRE
jgi:hypothetical protein